MLLLLLACTSPEDDTGTLAAPPPEPPAALTRWLVGSEDDAEVSPTGPALLIGGGGGDVDEAMAAWLSAAAGGDVVVLRTSGEDGYNDYLFDELGVAVDSVETLLLDSAALADAPYVVWRLQTAEAVFMAGGDQWTYLSLWSGTATQEALRGLWERGGSIGGTSAGAAVLGQRAFSAEEGTVYSDEALADPYSRYMHFADDFLALPPLAGVITDTHFYERDRLGRLVTFVARAIADGQGTPFVGIGVDEDTAVLLDASGSGSVMGSGYAYVVDGQSAPTVCEAGQPLSVTDWPYHIVPAGSSLTLPAVTSTGEARTLSVDAGTLYPANPY